MNITDAAYQRMNEVLQDDDLPDTACIRVYIQGGGCAGFSYGIDVTEQPNEDDFVFEKHDAKVVIDPMSLMYLETATLDYVTDLRGEMFTFKNPQAKTTCGCGSSFSV